MVFFLKCPVKIGQVAKPYGQRDLQNGRIPLLKQLHRLLKPQVVNIFYAGHAHMFFKKTHKMIIAEIA